MWAKGWIGRVRESLGRAPPRDRVAILIVLPGIFRTAKLGFRKAWKVTPWIRAAVVLHGCYEFCFSFYAVILFGSVSKLKNNRLRTSQGANEQTVKSYPIMSFHAKLNAKKKFLWDFILTFIDSFGGLFLWRINERIMIKMMVTDVNSNYCLSEWRHHNHPTFSALSIAIPRIKTVP